MSLPTLNPTLKTKRSVTGHHTLLPSTQPPSRSRAFHINTKDLLIAPVAWTIGRGSVIWRIWPAVLLHTAFAALIVYLKIVRHFDSLAIPNVLLTVLGVVIGFVISYRAMSGYDRYWMGRGAWSDVIRTTRTMARLIWIHVPPKLSTTKKEGIERDIEIEKVMEEKRMALDLVEGFAVALKHYLRGETGIYYEDLYGLVRPLHEHRSDTQTYTEVEVEVEGSDIAQGKSTAVRTIQLSSPQASTSFDLGPTNTDGIETQKYDPYIPPINAYGTFRAFHRNRSTTSVLTQPLMPSRVPPSNTNTRIERGLIPFAGVFAEVWAWWSKKDSDSDETRLHRTHTTSLGKHRSQPKENLPWEILRCLSEWFSILEERSTVPGTSLGGLISSISTLEDSLGVLDKILTTPLPFVYSVHIRHTVWIYLFFLPFQLVQDFEWYTILGVGIAAFIYLGFLAAGGEIEQPFGAGEGSLFF
ncbi:hypothetical protein E1B28_004224 [Marasmius oreades]|uniref:Uncharacterized protein n=1 Tax=Marasmius oreades TaxID=181124 RepID=A0A9P7UY96_9AGAR|nr:uncharacterized protein E1B28_004224 [Marasmius oreades]KAG7096815.1 hypothetical protein E1B28_004224 [Marasmius oreades]